MTVFPTAERLAATAQREAEMAEAQVRTAEAQLRKARLEQRIWATRHGRWLIFAKPFMYVAFGTAALLFAWGELFTPVGDLFVHDALTGAFCAPGDCIRTGG